MDAEKTDAGSSKQRDYLPPIFRDNYLNRFSGQLSEIDLDQYIDLIVKHKKNHASDDTTRTKKQRPNVQKLCRMLTLQPASVRDLHDEYVAFEKQARKPNLLPTYEEMRKKTNFPDQQDNHSADDEMQDVDDLTREEAENEGDRDPETRSTAKAQPNQSFHTRSGKSVP